MLMHHRPPTIVSSCWGTVLTITNNASEMVRSGLPAVGPSGLATAGHIGLPTAGMWITKIGKESTCSVLHYL